MFCGVVCWWVIFVFFFKQKTAYEMRISDWSSDVCSSDLMFQLLATFALVLVFNDLALWLWGPDDLLGPLAPGLNGALQIFDRYLPVYDLVLIVIGPARSAERRGGKACVSTCRSRWSPYH